MVTRLILVRHCQTQGNVRGIFQGRSDTPLSEQGIFQLGLLSARLKDVKIDHICSSPLGRALKTANAINAFHGVPITEEPGFAEIFMGEMDGMDCTEIPKRFYNAAWQWNERPWDFESPGGETMRQVYARVAGTAKRVVREHKGETVVVTSHGCALRTLLCWCAGLPIEDLPEIAIGHNTAVSVVEFDKNGLGKVVLISDSTHLPEDMRKQRRQFRFDLERV